MKTLLIIFSISCASFCFSQRSEMKKNGVTISEDKMTGKKSKQLNLYAGSLKLMAESSICLKTIDSSIALYSYLYQSDWLFVEKITIKVDGNIFEFKSDANRREVEPQAYVSEKNWYTTSEEFITAIKNAKSIEYRLHGKSYYEDFVVKESKLSVIPDFFK